MIRLLMLQTLFYLVYCNIGSFDDICGYNNRFPSPIIPNNTILNSIQLPILIICGHVGPCSDLLYLLEIGLNISKEYIDIYGYYMGSSLKRFNSQNFNNVELNHTELYRISNANAMIEFLNQHNFYATRYSIEQWSNVNQSTKQGFMQISSIYPTIWCEFPSNQCAFFQSVAKRLVIRFSHRYHHHLNSDQIIDFREWINKKLTNNVLVSANNLFDMEYIRQYLGINPYCIPSLYYNMQSYNYTNNQINEILLLPHHSPADLDQEKYYVQQNIQSNIPSNLKLNYINAYLNRRFEKEDLGKWPLAVLIPYAVHTSAINEMYSLGVPIVAPTVRFLIEYHYYLLQHSKICHTICGALTHIHGYIPNNNVNTSLHCDITNKFNSTCLNEWIRFSDFYHFPNITYFDSMSELKNVVNDLHSNSTLRYQISQASRKYIHEMKDQILHNLKSIVSY